MSDGYQPHPDTWPGLVAAYVAMARARLADPGSSLKTGDLVADALRERGVEADPYSASDLQVAETRFLCLQALLQMQADGEVVGSMGESPSDYLRTLRRHFGWDSDWDIKENPPNLFIGTARLQQIHAAEWATLDTWPGVDALVREARAAYAQGLYVAAAVTLRVAVEQAIEESLRDLGVDPAQWESEGAAVRERLALDRLRSKFRDQPRDYSATGAILSSVRNLGNSAAHDGSVDDAALHALLQVQVAQALVSLRGAVRTALST